MKKLILLISFILVGITTQATVHVVDSLNDAGTGSLRSKIALASNGDTIRFNTNLIANGSDTIVLATSISFSKSLTIKGLYNMSDTLVISSITSDNIFTVSNVSMVVFDSLVVFDNKSITGSNSFFGYGIQTAHVDSLIVRNSEIKNNQKGGQNSNGIYMDPTGVTDNDSKAYLEIYNSNISDNRGNGVQIDAPVINTYVHLITVKISNSNISNNEGSGLVIQGMDTIRIIIDSSDVNGNTRGCRLTMRPDTANQAYIETLLSNSSFENNGIGVDIILQGNSAVHYGDLNSKLEIKNSFFSGNGNGITGAVKVQMGHTITHAFPGSIQSDILLENSTITNSNGQAINARLDPNSSNHINSYHKSWITIKNSTISSSTIPTGYTGAAIQNFVNLQNTTLGTASANIWIKNSTLVNNTSPTNNSGISNGTTQIGTSLTSITGSILSKNGTSFMAPFYSGITFSGGYNIFSDSTVLNSVSTDQLNVDSTSLNLGSLSYNGGTTPTMAPMVPSVAIDAGDPLDLSDAQNLPIVGVREIGAAEACTRTFKHDTITAYDSYTWIDGNTYTQTDSSIVFTSVNAAGCDSLASLNLTILTSCRATDTITTCDSYTWRDGVTYYASTNTAQHIVSFPNGCDSIYTLNLTVTNTVVETYETCDSITWRDGNTYTQTNHSARDTVTVVGVCDSIYILDLTVHAPEFTSDVYTVCDSLTWINGVTYYSSTNMIYDTLANRHGCDSIVNLDLTVNQSHHDTDNVSACLFYMWSNGQIYVTDNNTATQNFTSTIGCDSILHLDLQIHQGTFATDTHVVCDSLVWIDGNTYYSNNTTAIYTLVGGNSNGCDSVVTLNLTVNSSSSTDVINSCSAYTWIDGNTYTSSNHTATHTLTNYLGCDSVVTLNLTINVTTYGTETISACDTYTWNGITYSSNNNTAKDTLVNAFGCDSIITLDLTILPSTTATDVISSCDPITWLDGNTYSSSNNTATHTVANSAGCDSVITLDFTLLQPTAGTDVVTSCNEITWIDGNVYSGTISGPTFTIPNAAGCDSVITLDFTLLEVDTAVVRNYLTLTAQATNATYQWIDCENGKINGETNADFTATQNGDYQVEVTQYGCVDTSACFSITNVGIQQAQLLGVNVYPNPTSDVLHIDKGSNVSLEITVTNSTGALVYNSSTEDQITTINMAKMASGVYVVTLRNELGVSVERIVKR